MNKLFLVLVAVVIVSVPAFASVQNVKVSGSINSTYIDRSDFDFGHSSNAAEDQNTFITQTELRIDADLTDNVSATIAFINERPWESEPNGMSADIQLQLAFATLREFLYSPLTLTVGRQSFIFGNGFVMDSAAGGGTSGIGSVASDLSNIFALDAIRATFDYNPLTLDVLYIVDNDSDDSSFHTDKPTGSRILGVNANYVLGDSNDSLVEAYVWNKLDKANANTVNEKEEKIYVFGLRGSTNPIESLNLQVEWAHQTGSVDTGTETAANRNAHAFQVIASYKLPVLMEKNPVLTYSFSKYSGDASPWAGDDRRSSWDSFYSDQLNGSIAYNIFSKSNLLVNDVSLELKPIEDLTAIVRWQGFWLDKKYEDGSEIESGFLSGLTGSEETFSGSQVNYKQSYLGSEFDLDLTYDYTEDVQVGTTLGYFFPGDFFTNENDKTAQQVLVNLNVAF